MIEFYPEGRLIDSSENRSYTQSPSGLAEAYSSEKILEARAIICDSEHNLIVDLGCMKGIIPREEGAVGIKEGTVRDIAVISKVNRAVSFVITDFTKNDKGKDVAILSRRKAQEICMEKYINNLSPGDVIPARVTHMENFGVFADIGCGIVSFLPIDTLSISRIAHPKERFSVGMDIKAVVKYLDGGRVHLTHKELLGTWEENASLFSIGETVGGIVRSVEDYGVFVELTPNLAGLAEPYPEAVEGQQVSVYIKNIVPDKMKIKLVIIDTFDILTTQTPLKYFYQGAHMDSFLYSPEKNTKIIETHFEPCVCHS